MQKKKKFRRKQRFVELTTAINAIPEGVYELIRRDPLGAMLSLGQKIQIGIIGELQGTLRPLSSKEGKERRMSEEEFVDKYYALLELIKGRPSDPTRPYTFCGLDASLARELH